MGPGFSPDNNPTNQRGFSPWDILAFAVAFLSVILFGNLLLARSAVGAPSVIFFAPDGILQVDVTSHANATAARHRRAAVLFKL